MSFTKIQDKLLSDFEKFQGSLNGSVSSNQNVLRIKAIEAFKELGLPTIKHEDWKYSNFKAINEIDYNFSSKGNITAETANQLKIEGVNITFVNGFLQNNLSDDFSNIADLQALPLSVAFQELPDIMAANYGKHAQSEVDGNNAINNAMASEGIVLVIKANKTLAKPIVLNFITDTTKENIGTIVHNLIVAEKNAEAKIVETFTTIGENAAFGNIITEIVVEEDARLDYYKIQDESDAAYHIGTTQVVQKSKSYFYSATVTINGGFVRNNLNLVLEGEHIDNHLYGLYIPNGKQHVDNHSIVDHKLPNSQSNELYKGILMGSSTGVFNGKIFVREDAQKTNAYQHCKNVITSDNATMNSKPQLEIWADDVKCSHGTTTGKLNEDAIFYMQSRGIPKDQAVKLQLLAFASDIITHIKIDALQEQLIEKIEAKLTVA